MRKYAKPKPITRAAAPDGGPLRAGLYCRVSTDEQGEKGYSIADQDAKGTETIRQAGHRLVKVWHENFTGTVAERPDFDDLRRMIGRGQLDVIWTWNGDRLGRGDMRTVCLWLIERQGVRVEYVEAPRDNSLSGKQLQGMKGLFSQIEIDTLRVRTANGREAKARAGKRVTGRAPFGYQLDPHRKGYLVLDPKLAPMARKIFEWLVYDQRSLRWIAAELTRRGVRQWRGTRWAPTSVRAILKRRVYMGKHRNMGRADLEIDVPAIIPAGLYRDAQTALARNRAQKSGRPPIEPDFILRGLIEHVCGRRMHCRHIKGDRFYECPNLDEPHRYAHAAKTEAQVWQRVIRTWDDPVEAEAFARRVAGYQDSRAAQDVEWQSNVAFLQGEEAKETAVIERMSRALRHPDAPEELIEELAAAKRRRDDVRSRLGAAKAAGETQGPTLAEAEIRAMVRRYERLVRDAKTPQLKAALLQSALTRIIAGPRGAVHLDGILPWRSDRTMGGEKNCTVDGDDVNNSSLDYRVTVGAAP